MKTFIFDIDGTLANVEHRLHHVKTKPKNWNKFFEEMDKDPPIMATCAICKDMLISNLYEVIFCTGRDEMYRDRTLKWLQENVHWDISGYQLFMRKHKDNRHDYIVKEEMLNDLKSINYNPIAVFEDRQQCVDMWRRNGLICYQVNTGDF